MAGGLSVDPGRAGEVGPFDACAAHRLGAVLAEPNQRPGATDGRRGTHAEDLESAYAGHRIALQRGAAGPTAEGGGAAVARHVGDLDALQGENGAVALLDPAAHVGPRTDETDLRAELPGLVAAREADGPPGGQRLVDRRPGSGVRRRLDPPRSIGRA